MTDKPDLRVIRTHKLIRDALITLLEAREFDHISVQDIVDTAMVNRATFYKYYSGKSDLAGAMIADFKTEYAALVAQRTQTDDPAAFFRTAAPLLAEKRRLLLALWKIRTKRHHLYDDMHRLIADTFRRHADAQKGSRDRTFQAHAYATLALSSLHYLLEHHQPVDVGGMVKEWREMVQLAGG